MRFHFRAAAFLPDLIGETAVSGQVRRQKPAHDSPTSHGHNSTATCGFMRRRVHFIAAQTILALI